MEVNEESRPHVYTNKKYTLLLVVCFEAFSDRKLK